MKLFRSQWKSFSDPTEGHLFVVGWTSTPSWGKPRAFQTLVVFLFWRRPYRRPPQGGGPGPVPIHGEVQEITVCCQGGPGSSWWRDERTFTNSLWYEKRDEINPHEKRDKQRACAYVSKGTCKLNIQSNCTIKKEKRGEIFVRSIDQWNHPSAVVLCAKNAKKVNKCMLLGKCRRNIMSTSPLCDGRWS